MTDDKRFVVEKEEFVKDKSFDEYINRVKSEKQYVISLHERTGNKLFDDDTPPLLIDISEDSRMMESFCENLNYWSDEYDRLEKENTVLKETIQMLEKQLEYHIKDDIEDYEQEVYTVHCGHIRNRYNKMLNIDFQEETDAILCCKLLNQLAKENTNCAMKLNEIFKWHKEFYGKSILDARMGW